MHGPLQLQFMPFGRDPLSKLPNTRQSQYLQYYLTDLGAKTVLVEPQYFDRDYLAEFSAFYSVSSRGYQNVCQRLHFFSRELTRDSFKRALQGSVRVKRQLDESYLGFTVIRPIPAAPLGRTVLAWYPDMKPATPRISEPSRQYFTHIAGLTFTVTGLAWQQQDTGVGACATVGLWTMLHSSAFDDHHAIPTTAEITRAAHRTASLGARVFPSSGLSISQLAEAIKEQNLAPMIITGDVPISGENTKGFSRERFASSCTALLRSGYPVLIIGVLGNAGLHAVCAVGFREAMATSAQQESVVLLDGNTDTLYIHDDNLGPSVRTQISSAAPTEPVFLIPDPPPPRFSPRANEPTLNYGPLIPTQLVVGVHDDIRLDPDALHRSGITRATGIEQLTNALLKKSAQLPLGFWLTTRLMKLSDYIADELERTIANPKALARTRLQLYETVGPMSLHLGIARVALDGARPIVDILFDTTDSVRNDSVFAHVAYFASFQEIIEILGPKWGDFGRAIPAY